MDQLYKFGVWLWRNKEKVVLVVLVLFLCVRTYRVVMGAEPQQAKVHPPVKSDLPEDWNGAPPKPPVRPAVPKPPKESLIRSNMFTVYGKPVEESKTQEVTPDSIGVTLVRIVPWKENEYRAELLTKGRRPKRYKEGEQFENFRLNRIDAANNSVEIWSEQYGKTFVLQAKEAKAGTATR